MHTAAIKGVDIDSSGRYAVTASEDKSARVWDVGSGRLLQVLHLPQGTGSEGTLDAQAMSPDGTLVAVAGITGYEWDNTFSVDVFDRGSGRLVRRLHDLPNLVTYLAFSPDGRWLAAGLSGTGGLRVWDANRWAAPLQDGSYGNLIESVSWSADGRLATSSADGQMRVYRVAEQGLTKLASGAAPGKKPFGIAFSPDGLSLAVGYADESDRARVDVLDPNTLGLRFSPDMNGVTNGILVEVTWSLDGRSLYAAGTWGLHNVIVRRWPDGGRGKAVDVQAASRRQVNGLRPLPGGGVLVAAANFWGVIDAHDIWHSRGTPPTAELRNKQTDVYGEAIKDFQGYALSQDASRVQFGFQRDGEVPYRFDVRRRALTPGTAADLFPPNVNGLNVESWSADSKNPTLDGNSLPLDPDEQSLGLAISPDAQHFALGTVYKVRLFDVSGQQLWQRITPDLAYGVNIPANGKTVVAFLADGTIRWYRITDGRELLAFFPHADRQRWVLWTPSGYYDASPGGEDLIGWHLNRGADQAADFFPAARFRAKFHRPDVIDRVLDTLDEDEALRLADVESGRRAESAPSVARILPPVIDLMSPADVRTAEDKITIRARARTAADAPVTGWRVRVNGQAVPLERGLARMQSAGEEREVVVPLPAQDAEVQVFAENDHGISSPATVRVTWTGRSDLAVPAHSPSTPNAAGSPTDEPGTAGAFVIRPTLYVLSIGVSQYSHPDIPKLGLAAKDADDFVATMQRQKGKLYRDVQVRLLTDAKATRDDVVDGLDWLQKQVTQHDVGMVFLSGHGLNDASLGYVYLPVNADPAKLKRTGVTMSDFRSTLANLTGKAVFFLDTCHAGNVLGSMRKGEIDDVSAVINELASAENGVVVFSSSTGRQSSLEDRAWGNGAFAKAVNEGLNGGADFQKSGRITYKMLDLYVSDRVKELTHGMQSPVTQAPGGVPDFPLAMTR
jgi:WD40 repeat protein/uncharacterized caspase-like protein